MTTIWRGGVPGHCGVLLLLVWLVGPACSRVDTGEAPKVEPTPVKQAQVAAPAKAETPAPAAKTGKPQIQIVEEKFDFGDVAQGDKAKHTFVIKNVGDAVLNIKRAKGS